MQPRGRAASIALGSVAPTIVEAARAQVFLVGRELNRPTIEEASRLVAAAATPIDDIRAGNPPSNAELLEINCDVLVPAAIEGVITVKNADERFRQKALFA